MPVAEPLPIVRDCSRDDPFPERHFSGRATAVIDGDSFCLGDFEIRLRRFNAPEWNEPGGPEATARLSAVLGQAGELACEGFARSWDRVIAECHLSDGRELGAVLKGE